MSLRKDKVQLDIEINGKKAGKTYGQIKKDMRQLNRELNKMTPGTDEFIKKSKELTKVRDRYRKVKDQIYGIDRSLVGTIKHMFSMQNVVRGLGQILPSLGIAGILYKTQQAFSSLVTTTRDYGKALSTLQSLTGASAADIEFYNEKAKELGISLKTSAIEVVNAFKIVGSQRPELLKNRDALAEVTEKAIILSKAADIDLRRSVDAVTGSMNQWQKTTEETDQVINTLAAGSKVGAADIPSLADAIDKSGTSAANFNVTMEESVGLLETFGEFNLKGAEAGTKLRNVLSIMQSAKALPPEAISRMEEYGVNLDIVTDKNRSFEERLTELAKIQDDATAITKVFGRENQVAGTIALQNVDKFVAYTEAVTGTNTAFEQAETNMDNLEGDWEEFNAVVEVFATRSGSLVNNALRNIVQTGTQVLLVIQEIPTFLRENRSEIIALTSAIVFFNSAQVAQAALALKARAATLLSAAAAKAATIQFNALNFVMRSNPYVLAASALVALGAAIYSVWKRTRDLKDETIALSKEGQKQVDSLKKQRAEASSLFDMLNQLNGRLGELKEGTETYNAVAEEKRRVIDRINDQYGDYLPKLLTEKSSIDDIRIAQEAANKELLKKQLILAYEDRIKQALDDEIERRVRLQEIERSRARTRSIAEDPRFSDVAALRQQELDLLQGVEEEGIKSSQNAREEVTNNFKAIFEDIGIAWEEVLNEINSSEITPEAPDAPPAPPPTPDPDKPDSDKEEEDQSKIFDARIREAELYADRYNLILEAQYSRGLITEEEYNDRVIENQRRLFDLKETILEEGGEKELQALEKLKNERLAFENELELEAKAEREDPERALEGIRRKHRLEEIELKEKFANQLIAEQEYQEQLDQMRLDFYQDQLDKLEAAGLAETETYIRIKEMMLEAEISANERSEENTQRTIDVKKELHDAATTAFSDSISAGIDLLAKDEEAREKNAATIKAFETGRILVNSYAEISEYWKTYAGVPGGQLIAGLLTAAAVARSIGAIAQVNAAEFAFGGKILPEFDSRDGRVRGRPNIRPTARGDNMLAYVRVGETMLNDEQVEMLGGPAIMRQIGVPGYAEGGRMSTTSVDTTPRLIDTPNSKNNQLDSAKIVDTLLLVKGSIDRFDRELQAKIVYSEFEKLQKEVQDIRERTAL